MKILMVTRERAADRRYGLGKSLAPVVEELQSRGIEVRYLSQQDVGLKSARLLERFSRLLLATSRRGLIDLNLVALAHAFAERLNMGRLAQKVARHDRFDHVHCHDPLIAVGVRLFGFGRSTTFRWGVTEHGFGSYTQALHEDGAPLSTSRMRWLRRLELATLLRAQWVITPNKRALAELARDLCAYPVPDHWRAIPHPRPMSLQSDRTRARRALGWIPDAFYFLGVGRLAPLKNFEALIRAFAKLRVDDARLVIVGVGESAPLQAIADACGVRDKIAFSVTDDMAPYYAASDIYVSTSWTESFGLANLEALAAGVPTLCTAAGAVPDVLGTASYLFPPGDEQALVNLMQEVRDSPALRSRIARRGLERVARWPTASMTTELYLSAYRGVAVRADSAAGADPMIEPMAAHVWAPVIESFEICPLPRELTLPSAKRVLVFAPHPDDEVLACGGTIALLQRNGCQVRVVVMTDGSRGDPRGYFSGDISSRRYAESRTALGVLGISDVQFLGYPDGDLRPRGDVTRRIQGIIEDFAPDLLFLPPVLDHHRDHVAGSLAVLQAWHATHCTSRALMWELWQALPINRVSNISAVFDLRQRAADCYLVALKYCDYTGVSAGLASYRSLCLEDASWAEGFLELNRRTCWSVMDHLLSLRAGAESRKIGD
ncbi:MAG: PIG-L family deacetylase [Thiohalocapsa sp.]